MFWPTQPSSGALNLVRGTAAPSYAVEIWVDAFFTLTIHSKVEVCVVSLFMYSMCCILVVVCLLHAMCSCVICWLLKSVWYSHEDGWAKINMTVKWVAMSCMSGVQLLVGTFLSTVHKIACYLTGITPSVAYLTGIKSVKLSLCLTN
jgi:hypothetical protein